MSTYHYSVVRFVPSAIRGETINIGVVVASDDPPTFQVRFLDEQQGKRLRQAGFADDIGFIKDLEGEMQAHEVSSERMKIPGGWDLGSLREAAAWWANSIQFSEPRVAVHKASPAVLLEELFDDYVVVDFPERAQRRGRPWLKKRVREGLRRALVQAHPGLDPREFVKPALVKGKYDDHRFDYALGNGQLLGLVQTLSFKSKDRTHVARSIDAVAWAIDDLRKADDSIDVDVVSIGAGPQRDEAARIYGGLGANLVRETNVSSWIDNKGKQLAMAIE